MLLRCSLFVSALSLVAACDWSAPKIGEICSDNPQICDDIQTEGWCRYERAQLIRRRDLDLRQPSNEDNQYRMLLDWQSFRDCVNLAAQVQHVKSKDKSTVRNEAYLASLKNIAELQQRIRKSTYPPLVYYRWSQSGSERDLRLLLKLDRDGKMQTTEMQQMIATYYAKYDKPREIEAHLKALEYLGPEEEIPLSIFASLATDYYQRKENELAYIWSLLAHEHQMEAVALDELRAKLGADPDRLGQLDDIADEVIDSIHNRDFVRPRLLLESL